MSPEGEEIFQLSNICCICDKLFDVGDDKVKDHTSGKLSYNSKI